MVRDLVKKLGVNEVHGYQPFPSGIPQKLVETSDLRFLHRRQLFSSPQLGSDWFSLIPSTY